MGIAYSFSGLAHDIMLGSVVASWHGSGAVAQSLHLIHKHKGCVWRGEG